MILRIFLLVFVFITPFYSNSSKATGTITPKSLDGLTIITNITDTKIYDEAIHFAKTTGEIKTHLSLTDLFYDATAFNGWHFSLNYVLKRQDKSSSLVISTRLPDSSLDSELFTFRQTLKFADKMSGESIIEFFDSGRLVASHKGNFFISDECFEINVGGLKDRRLSFKSADKNVIASPINIGNKLEMFFLNEESIRLLSNGEEYFGINESVKQTSVSTVAMRGRLNNGIAYDLNLTYKDFTNGVAQLSLDGNVLLRSSFTSHRVTADKRVPLEGQIIDENVIHSQHTDILYSYEVYLPPGYSLSKKNYPVVYITDGQWETDLANIIDANKKNVILIFINQGPNDRRLIDYSLQGADAYIKFLREELVPLVESKYRSNGARTFFGASLGGLLGAILISREKAEKPFFKNYILADGSFWGLPSVMNVLPITFQTTEHQMPINIVLTGTRRGNGLDVVNYEKRLREYNSKNINIYTSMLPYLHDEMTGPTLANAIELLE